MRESIATGHVAHGGRVSGRAVTGGSALDLYFELGERGPSDAVEPFIIRRALPPMVAGDPLVVEAPVSLRLLQALDEVQSIFPGWARSKRIEIRAEAGGNPRPVRAKNRLRYARMKRYLSAAQRM